ncbi:MAG: phosphoribosyltransferase [Chloroflexaceae bacterium]|nr:phosphoribosyltransferase [Chloroflexaceae bacterium]NJO05562.1 phosphoribosyltransferase [Chloroflexaceae bacterium]
MIEREPYDDTMMILERLGAIVANSHIVYTSGRHGRAYVNKDALYPYTQETSLIAARIAAAFADDQIEIVAGPTIGGVILAQWVAHHLGYVLGRPVLAVFAEEQIGIDGSRLRVFRRGYADYLTSRRVLVVEDVLTTGQSARAVVDAVDAAGGQVAGLGALCNRGGVTAEILHVPRLAALVDLPLESWDEAECPLCAAGVPVNTAVGKGAEFVARTQHPDA